MRSATATKNASQDGGEVALADLLPAGAPHERIASAPVAHVPVFYPDADQRPRDARVRHDVGRRLLDLHDVAAVREAPLYHTALQQLQQVPPQGSVPVGGPLLPHMMFRVSGNATRHLGLISDAPWFNAPSLTTTTVLRVRDARHIAIGGSES